MKTAHLVVLLACLVALTVLPAANGRVRPFKSAVKIPIPAPTFAPPLVANATHQKAEKEALLAFAAAFNNHPIFAHGNWIESLPLYPGTISPCQDDWPYLTCTTTGGYVLSINLPITQINLINASWGPLVGEMPWDKLTALTDLKAIDLSGNHISGNVLPPNAQDFPGLERVVMFSNKFANPLPSTMSQLTHLNYVDLSQNQITGPIPSNLDRLPYLQRLVLYSNQMTGTLPVEFGNMPNLNRLDLGQNNFNGTIPAAWGNMSALGYLALGKNSLTGTIPATFAKLPKSMYVFDVDNNQLTGEIPDFVTTWNLSSFDVSTNQFYGPIPAGLMSKNYLMFDVSNNYFNQSTGTANSVLVDSQNCVPTFMNQRSAADCQTFYNMLYSNGTAALKKSKGGSSFPVAAAAVPVAVICLAIAALLFLLMRRRRSQQRTQAMFSKGFKNTVASFALSDLKRATKNFSQTIGKGGYGTVYKAVLKDGTIVAVKRLDQVSKQGDVEFIREVELLSRLHHRHLVNLVGFCAERGERILVYEYMAMGSLYEHLHGASSKEYPLSWDSRTKIAIHIALGLEYLHYGADPPLIHRDIKSANILLSEDGYSKVADFGLCKEAPLGADGSETMVPTATAVRGSFGYLDPEYVNTSILSEKSDVYSYGVVLLELISGHKSIHEWQPLAYWAEEYLADREKTPLMVDPALEGNFDIDELYAICDIARTCVQDQAVVRPTIRDVAKALVENLGHTLSSYAGSTRDSASVMSSGIHSETSSVTGSSYTPNEASQSEMSYQNYSETLHWTPPDSGKVDLSGSGSGMKTRFPVPMPKKKPAPTATEKNETNTAPDSKESK